MAARKNKYEVLIPMNDEQAHVAKMLVANLIYVPFTEADKKMGLDPYPENRIPEMGDFRITPEMLERSGLSDEAEVLAAIYSIVAMHGTPDEETIRTTLTMRLSNSARAAQIVERVKSMRSLPPMITPLAAGLSGWYERQKIVRGLEEMLKLAKSNREDTEVRAELLAFMREITPRAGTISISSYADAQQEAMAYMAEAALRKRHGKSRGPQYPWDALNQLIQGGMRPGHMWLWSAKTKHGKTTFAHEIGRHIAFNQPEYLVASFHLETDRLDIAMREFARELVIQPGALYDGEVDPYAFQWEAEFERIRAKTIERVGEGRYAKYQYIHCPGLTIQDLEATIMEQKSIAEAMGLEGVVVILDYYQIMDWQASTGAREETEGLNRLAIRLKDMFEITNKKGNVRVYGIVFAQDSVTQDRRVPFGGTMIAQRAQGHIQIQAFDEAPTDKPVRGEGDVQQYDALGKPMYWHRQGDPHCDRCIQIVRANGVRPGRMFVRVANGYFIIKEIPEAPMWWKDLQERKRRKAQKDLA